MSRALQPGAAPAGWVLGDTEFGLFQHAQMQRAVHARHLGKRGGDRERD